MKSDSFFNVSPVTAKNSPKANAMRTAMKQRYDSLGVIYIQPENGGEGLVTPESGRIKQPTPAYYYHSDHLGSSSLLSDNDGNVSQHIEYLPFGEVFVEERNNNWNTPYKFNAKELDDETGLYYYGARYFDSKTSVWYGVDPLGEKYPGLSPYVYCANNPLKFIDPDGRRIILVGSKEYRNQVMKDLKQLGKDNTDVSKIITGLISSKNTHIIEMPKGNDGYNYTSYNKKNAEMGIPQGSKIGYDPNNSETVRNDKRTPRVGLAHELKHSEDLDNGKLDTIKQTDTGVDITEVNAIKVENKIREKAGDKKRTTYGNNKISEKLLTD